MGIDIKRNYDAYGENPGPEERQRELDRKMKEFLEKGGKIEKCEPGVAASGAFTMDRIVRPDQKYKKQKSKKDIGDGGESK